MASKEELAQSLADEPTRPRLKRGQGMTLSTSSAEGAQSDERTSVKAHNRDDENKRVRRGYALREDLIKACKRIALEEDRHLYQVMEEALEKYVKEHRV